ncbi:hypothetical protein PoB_002616300 [Plakobranchus ocellatus]|uniref:Uncharacterized protein n=1 Tax=Plakobranchus ocellatus TaxID=259542 RepID=A0AAV3ZYZ5_9GAST|nr:hypothetical protein PoB_002616300 [Plakobranchus ocellatus]
MPVILLQQRRPSQPQGNGEAYGYRQQTHAPQPQYAAAATSHSPDDVAALRRELQSVDFKKQLPYQKICGLQEIVAVQIDLRTSRNSCRTNRSVDFKKQLPYQQICGLQETVAVTTDLWTSSQERQSSALK